MKRNTIILIAGVLIAGGVGYYLYTKHTKAVIVASKQPTDKNNSSTTDKVKAGLDSLTDLGHSLGIF